MLAAGREGEAMGGGRFISGLGVSGPVGSHELVNAWCRKAASCIDGPVYRYRLLNHPTALILLDGDNAQTQTSALDPLMAVEAEFSRERFMAEEITRAARRDAGSEPRDHPLLYAVWFTVPDSWAGELHRWYEQEHIPMLMGCPSWSAARRFRLLTTPRKAHSTFLALHYLADATALTSPERDAARRTPWRERLAREEWFRGTYQVFLRERDA
jgi:hypothetical protein